MRIDFLNGSAMFALAFLTIFSANSQSSLSRFDARIEGFIDKEERDSAQHYAAIILREAKLADSLEVWLWTRWKVASLDRSDYGVFIHSLESIDREKWRMPLTAAEWHPILFIESNLGYYLGKSGRISAAINAYSRADSIAHLFEYPGFDAVESMYKGWGNMYTRLGDNEKALVIQQKALAKSVDNPDHNKLAGLYTNLGITCWNMGEFLKSEEYLRQGLQLTDLEPRRAANLKVNLSRTLLDQGRLEDSRTAAEAAIKLCVKPKNPGVLAALSSAYTQMALLELRSSRPALTLRYLKNTWEVQQKMANVEDRELAKQNLMEAEAWLQLKQPETAMEIANKAIALVLPDFKPQNTAENPSVMYFYQENVIGEGLHFKALALEQMYYKKEDKHFLEQAVETLDLAWEANQLLRQAYIYQSSKLNLQATWKLWDEDALRICRMLHDKTGDEQWAVKAFAIVERNKAGILLDALRENLARQDHENSDPRFATLSLLRQNAAWLEQEYRTETDTSSLSQLSAEADALRTQIARMEQALRAEYPQWSRQIPEEINQSGIVSLDKNTLLIAYFSGKAFLDIFLRNADGQILEWKRMAASDSIRVLQQQFLSFFEGPNAILSNPADYFSTAYRLRELLLPSAVLNWEQWVIAPDGLTALVPFEALLESLPNAGTSLANAPYLIRRHEISYIWSLSSLRWQQALKSAPGRTMLGVAPGFAGGHRGLQPLSADGEEWGGLKGVTSLTGASAAHQAFVANAGQYPLVHLATHAEGGTMPSIELWDKTMYLPEIYGLPLHADLVVLSGCETGLGKQAGGEGIMSLSRAFACAGARGLIASLWKVNDRATVSIFSDFYNILQRGGRKSEALRQAKLGYLSGTGNMASKSPWYWAGLTFSGADGPLNKPENKYWYYLFILLIPVFYLVFKKYFQLPNAPVMRSLLLFILTFSGFSYSFAQEKETPPAADFKVTTVDGKSSFVPVLPVLPPPPAGGQERFYTYHWEFGDGAFSNKEKPEHIYAAEGEYSAVLYATNNYDDGTPPKSPKKALRAAGYAGTVPPLETIITDQRKSIGLKAIREPRANEELVLIWSYQNISNMPTKGQLYLFFNEKSYKEKHFSFSEARTHFGETAAGPAVSMLPVQSENHADDWKMAFSNIALAGDGAGSMAGEFAPPGDVFVNNTRGYYRDEKSWVFPELLPGEKRNMFISLTSTPEMLKDTTAFIHVKGIFVPESTLVVAEEFELEMEIVSSHDPNLIAISDNRLNYRFIGIKPLKHKVRFQNNGEKPAEKIEITVNTPPGMKLGSVKLGDHYPKCPVCPKEGTTKSCIEYVTKDDKIVFTFRNVSLPGSKQEDMDYDSTKGYVNYTIDAERNMPKRPFRSRAEIVFDKNEPVVTNFTRSRFKPGLSVGAKAGYAFFPEKSMEQGGGWNSNFDQGYTFFGVSLSPYKSWRPYWQAELLTGIGGKTSSESTTESGPVVSTADNSNMEIALLGIKDTIIDSKIIKQSGTKKSTTFEVPVSIRKNFNRLIGAGVGISANIIRESGTAFADTTLFRTVITHNFAANGLIIASTITEPPVGTGLSESSFSNTFFRYNIFADLNIGLVRAGPHLGLRAGYQLGGDKGKLLVQLSAGIKF